MFRGEAAEVEHEGEVVIIQVCPAPSSRVPCTAWLMELLLGQQLLLGVLQVRADEQDAMLHTNRAALDGDHALRGRVGLRGLKRGSHNTMC